MTTPPEIARKVRQLDNDVQAIYEMLAGISATQLRQGNRLEEIAASQTDLATAQADLAAGQADLAVAQAEHGTKLDVILELLRGGPPADGR
jgi:phosphate uptake regulator